MGTRANPSRLFACLLGLFLSALPTPTAAMFEWIPPGTMCDSVHNYKPTPYNGVPPPMPTLPDRYTMNVQANILQKGWSTDVIEHYDGPNKRASVFLTFNGTTTQTIFNYKTMETYDIYPDGSCKTRSGKADYFGFYKMDRNNRPMKATVYEMWHMGPKMNFTYVGQTWVRGIRVNHWTSCQEWADFGAKFQLDYYFSHEDYQTAWGMGQIPIRAVVNGSAGNEDENRKHMFGRHKFEHIYDFTKFDTGEIKDLSVFEQPHDVVCTGRKDFKAMPNIPDNFQMDIEMNCPVMGSTMPFQHSIRYDWDHSLVETYMNIPSPQGNMDEMKRKLMEHHASDGKPGDLANLVKTDKMVMRAMSTVDDHNTGLRYVTEKVNHTCRVMEIPEQKEAMPMDHGKTLFDIHTEQKSGTPRFTYQGRSTFRNMPVDVWGIDNGGMIQKVFFMADDREPMLLKNKEDMSQHPWSNKDWRSKSSEEDEDDDYIAENPMAQMLTGGNPNRKPSGQARTTGMMSRSRSPFPVLVGMVFRNHTAISTRDMPTFFQEVMQPELINWKEQMANQFLDGENSKRTEGSSLHDQHAMVEKMHSKLMRHVGEMDMNVFNFQPLHTDETMFQVSQCYEPEQTSSVLLHVDTPFKTNVLTNMAAFSIAIRKGIAEAMGISYIQISNLKLEPHVDTKMNINGTYVSFTLLGTPPVEAPKMKPPSISEAKKRLVQAIRNGISFKVNYPTHTKSFLVDRNHYSVDRKIFKTPAKQDDREAPSESTSSDSDDSSYSSESVAGIAIATLLLGFVVAIAVVVILYRRRHPEEPVIPYRMTKK